MDDPRRTESPLPALRNMRILYLADRWSRRGGADLHLAQAIEGTLAAGGEVGLAVGRVERDAPLPAGVEPVRRRGLASAVATASGLCGLETLLAAADVVHVQNVMNPEALAAATATGRAVVTVQDHRFFCPGPGRTLPDGRRCATLMGDRTCAACLPDAAYRARLLALTAARRDALAGARLIALSQYVAAELAAVGPSEAQVIPPWVGVGPPRRAQGDTILLGGRLVAHKGVIEGWRAWRRSACDLPLRVAGDGPLAPALEGAERLGWLDPPALWAELRRARALLLPSRWQEPFGILAVEALAEGTPVIACDVGGVGEWSDEGCLRVPPGDEGAMADAIARLGAGPDLALELGHAGQAMVAERFARAPILDRLIAVYREVAGA